MPRTPKWNSYRPANDSKPPPPRRSTGHPKPKSTRLGAGTDARLEYAGTMCLIRIRGRKAHAWVRQNVMGMDGGPTIPPWQWHGPNAFICELRYAARIVATMQKEGFRVRGG